MKKQVIYLLILLSCIVVGACTKKDAEETTVGPKGADFTDRKEAPSTETQETPDTIVPEPEFQAERLKLEEVTEEMLSTYDNQVLTGSQVSAALSEFQGKRVAILVATRMVIDSTLAYNTFDGNVSSETPSVRSIGLTGVVNTAGELMDDKLTFINYGALLQGEQGTAAVTFNDGYFMAEAGLEVDGEDYITNTNLDNTMTPGTAENIAEYLHIQSYLIKDSAGEVIGIVFYAI